MKKSTADFTKKPLAEQKSGKKNEELMKAYQVSFFILLVQRIPADSNGQNGRMKGRSIDRARRKFGEE